MEVVVAVALVEALLLAARRRLQGRQGRGGPERRQRHPVGAMPRDRVRAGVMQPVRHRVEGTPLRHLAAATGRRVQARDRERPPGPAVVAGTRDPRSPKGHLSRSSSTSAPVSTAALR